LENVFLHAAAVLLFWRLLEKLEVPGAWLAAGILALHPLMVESVAWIAERKNVLSMVLFLAALLAYGRSVSFWTLEDAPWRPRAYALALALFLAALLAKVSVFALPPVLLLLAWWKRGRLRWRQELRPVLPFFLLAVLLGAGVMWLEKHHVGAEGTDWQATSMERLINSCHAWWFYVGKLLWPASLPPIYPPWDAAGVVVPSWCWPLSVFLLAFAVWWWRAWLGIGTVVALLFFTGTLLPVLGFFDVYGMLYAPVADRWVHLPALGLMALVAAAFGTLAGRLRHAWFLPVLAGILLPVLCWLTWRQAGLYTDNETLMHTALRMNPRCWGAAYNWGNIMAESQRGDDAVAFYREAIRLNPGHVKAHNNLGSALTRKGRFSEALPELQKAVELMPKLPVAQQNLGNCLLQMGRVEDAAAAFQKAIDLAPDLAAAHNNLAGVRYQQGRLEEAVMHFQRVVDLQPDSADALGNLGVVLVHSGHVREGESRYEMALKLHPRHQAVLANLSWLLATCPEDSIRNGPQALEYARQAEELAQGGSAEVLRSLAAALAETKNYQEAGMAANRAARVAQNGGQCRARGHHLAGDGFVPRRISQA
jgi:tetratricopeptide (TPR) repeat protein